MEHLYSRASLGGLKQPLKDLWALNIQSLVCNRGFSDIRSKRDLDDLDHGEWIENDKYIDWKWSTSMRITVQQDNATSEYLNSFSSWTPNLPNHFKRSRKQIYSELLAHSRDAVVIENNSVKLYRFTPSDTVVDNFHLTLDSIGKLLPDRIHATNLLLFCNSMPTTWRKRVTPLRDQAAETQGFPCKLCGGPKDWVEHIFTPASCPSIKQALQQKALSRIIKPDLLEALQTSSLPLFTHAYLADLPLSPDLIRFVLCFNWAIWMTYFEIQEGLHPSRAPTRISQLCTSSFTSAEKDKASKKKEKKEKFSAFIKTLPSSAITAYTDGSAVPNPGPCGAGAIIYFHGDTDPVRLFKPLPEGTNNYGEAWAIGMALAYLRDHGHSNDEIILFTDSRVTLGQLESGWKFRTNKANIHALQAIRAGFTILLIYKVPAHCGIEENEEADTLANVGSSLSPPLLTPDRFEYEVQSAAPMAHPG
jgi:ribonuclease HI